jgi:hypothetical protein
MPIVTRPDGHPALRKGLHVRVVLTSLARNFTGFRDLPDAWMYMKGFYCNYSLVSAHVFEYGSEVVRYTHHEGEQQMGLLNETRQANQHLLNTDAPFADKQVLADNAEVFTITNIRARASKFSSSKEYLFDIETLQPSLAYRTRDANKNLVAATEPTDTLTISLQSSDYRDNLVMALCSVLGLNYKKLMKEVEQECEGRYGPCVLCKVGKAFDIVDYEGGKPF